MMISCPRCKTMVSDDIAHCAECGYSIKNYLQNKNLCSNYYEENDSKSVSTIDKKAIDEENDSVEDNILKFLSNIKIVKDESYDAENDELDGNMHAFLVEALNDSYKIRSVTTVIKNPKEYLELEDEANAKKTSENSVDKKGDSQEKVEESLDKVQETIEKIVEECLSEKKETVENKQDNKENNHTDEVRENLKLVEPEGVGSLELVELNICESDNKKDDATNKEVTSKRNLELNTHELEIIHKRKIKLPEDFELKNGLIIKEGSEEKNYDKFYDTISSLRKDKYNKKVIIAVASATGVFVAIVVLISGLIMG